MLAKIQDFERTFEQRYGGKMTDYELSMLKPGREILDPEVRAENQKKRQLRACLQARRLRRLKELL